MSHNTPSPGWYETETPGQHRWWDGQQWTEQLSPAAALTERKDLEAQASPRPLLGWGSFFIVAGTAVFGAVLLLAHWSSDENAVFAGLLGFVGGGFVASGITSVVQGRAALKQRRLEQ